MIPVYICDDEPAISAQLERLVGDQIMMMERDMGPLQVVDNPVSLLSLQKKADVPAIYFLDIDFPGYMSGLELAVKLRQYDPRGFIVFITAHDDMMFETFRYRLEALDYIVKGEPSVMAQRVNACLESICERLMSHFEEKLGEAFWRCHRSFLVNRARIGNVRLKESMVELDNGETCLLSRKAKAEYASALHS